MSTPSLTMFTATIHGSRESVKRASFSAARASVCTTTSGARAGHLAQHLRDRARVLAVGRDDEPAGVAVPAGAQALEPLVRLLRGSAAGRPAARR